MKKILSIILVLALLFALFPLQSSLSDEVTPPEGFAFSNKYQRIQVTLNSKIYYAYEIEKKENNARTVGWLIVDSSNKAVTDRSTYEKLALAATVTKYIEENPNISTIIEADLKMLSELKWKMALYEVNQSVVKTVSSFLGTATGNIPKGAFEEFVGLSSFVPQAMIIELSDKYLDEFANWVADNFFEILIKTGEIAGKLDSGQNFLKFCGVLESIIKKGALISAKKGIESYREAYNIFKNHSGSWSYEDAQKFLERYIKGKAQAVAYGSWYLRLIPHDDNWFKTVGLTVWDNVVKQVLPAEIGEITNAADVATKFVPLYIKVIKESPDKFLYNKVEEDIKNLTALLNILRMFYNTSIKDGPASTVYEAVKASFTGILSVKSTPSGAKVYVNGYYKGVTPIDISLAPGNYSVKLTKNGYEDYTTNSKILAEKTTTINTNLNKIVPKPKNSLIGKWKLREEVVRGYRYDRSNWVYFLEFLEDGTVIMTDSSGSYAGSYKIIDENRVSFSGPLVNTVFDYIVGPDYLELSNLNSSMILNRVK
jgi:hypothetical protein